MKNSVLDGVSGLGPSRRARLIKELGSINKIRQATLEDLLKLTWLPDEVAKSVYQNVQTPIDHVNNCEECQKHLG